MAIAYADFPIICSCLIKDEYLIVGGGGGATRSGIKNGIIIFRYIPSDNNFYRSSNVWYEKESPMKIFATREELIVVCDYKIHKYHIKYVNDDTMTIVDPFSISPQLHDSYASAADLDDLNNLLYLGDSRGTIHVLDTFSFQIVRKFEAHATLINSISINPTSNFIATSSFNKDCCVWNLPLLIKAFDINPTFLNPNYFVRNLKFLKIEQSVFLYTVHLQTSRIPPSVIIKWCANSFTPLLRVESFEIFVCLQVDQNHGLLFLGSSCGRLKIFSAEKLKLIKSTKEIHSAGISSICCLKDGNMNFAITCSPDITVVLTKHNTTSGWISRFKIFIIIIVVLSALVVSELFKFIN